MTIFTPLEVATVPAALRAFAEWFLIRHDIRGICDPMYVCNVTAWHLGLGDGQGNFHPAGSADETLLQDACNRLVGAYSGCIAGTNGTAAAILEKLRLIQAVPPVEKLSDRKVILAKLRKFVAQERNNGAEEGLACELAVSLLEEAKEDGYGCLQNLPPLKQAILTYVLTAFDPTDDSEN